MLVCKLSPIGMHTFIKEFAKSAENVLHQISEREITRRDHCGFCLIPSENETKPDIWLWISYNDGGWTCSVSNLIWSVTDASCKVKPRFKLVPWSLPDQMSQRIKLIYTDLKPQPSLLFVDAPLHILFIIWPALIFVVVMIERYFQAEIMFYMWIVLHSEVTTCLVINALHTIKS